MVIGIDTSVLLGFYQAKAGVGASGSVATSATSAAVAKIPTAPWSGSGPTAAQTSAAVTAALAGHKLIDESAAKLDVPGASADYKKLFALYQGLTTLSDVANHYSAKGVSSGDKTRINATFQKGLAEIASYVGAAKFDQLRLVEGSLNTVAKTTVTVPNAKTEYVTPPLTASTIDEAPAFQGNVKFDISIKRINTTFDIPIDLSGMGADPRTLGNVISYINGQLSDAGVGTRLQSVRIPATPRTVSVGGKDVTVSAGSDQWALKVKVGTSEAVTLTPVDTAPAIYVAQDVGTVTTATTLTNGSLTTKTTDDTQRQLLKFQTDTTNVDAPTQGAGEAYWTEGRVFSQNLDPNVLTVHDTKIGPDGAVYMLADVAGKDASGQITKGAQDVALLKYDSAGKLLYSRNLGAASTATGLALAVSDSGQVAVAGSVTGALSGAQEGPVNSGATGAFATNSDSFVTLYDGQGQEVWTERRGVRLNDEASEVAFGADGSVYVAGRSQSAMPGTTGVGGWDSYVEGFKADAKGKVQTLFSQAFGSAGSDKPAGLLVDNGSLVTASVEDGHAVLRRFDISSGAAATLTATRDLGDLQGGSLAGLALDGGQVVVAGTTTNGALAAGAPMKPLSGGADAFVARLSLDLVAAPPTDAIAYYGGTGDDKATALTVSGGKVYIGGSAGAGDFPDQVQVGKSDGFLAQIDIGAGQVSWSSRFSGKDGVAAPTAIAAAAQGASVLDRIGLPSGLLDLSVSTELTANSGLRAGDQFTLKVGGETTRTLTIDQAETLDTLAQKIRRVTGFQATVSLATVNGARQLKIAPLNDRTLIQIGAGSANQDALAQLGLPEGVVRNTTVTDAGKTVPADEKGMIYGLTLASSLNLSSAEQIRHTVSELAQAQGVVRQAYKDLVAAAQPKSAASAATNKSANGPVPAYLTAQIASYQAALDRLTAGGSSTGAASSGDIASVLLGG